MMCHGEESLSRPSTVALNHAAKYLNFTLRTLAGSAPGHMMLLPPVQIPVDAADSLLSSLLRPNQACVAWERQAPGQAASASGSASEPRRRKLTIN